MFVFLLSVSFFFDQQKDSDSVIDKRVEEIAVQLKKSESRNDSLSSDLQNATSGLKAAEAEVSTLKGKLQELEQNLKQADASREASSKQQVQDFDSISF